MLSCHRTGNGGFFRFIALNLEQDIMRTA